ncbi:hypothetical protein OAD13_04445 [Candidatus Pelagibacter sp.]|nr:hypothetical protein [Candidatus Pelagibacter sp.]
MKKKIFAIIIDNERLSIYSKNIKYFLGNIKKYVPEGVEIYLIDISNLHLIKKTKIEISEENIEFNYFSPQNFRELYNFSNNNKILAMVKIRENFGNLRLNCLLNFITFKRIVINVDGFFVVADKVKNFSIFEKINVFINIKLSYYFYRIISLLGIVKKIDLLITASQTNINRIKSGISSRIENIIPINLSYIKKIYRVNSNLDENLSKKDLSEKFIVFCDSGFDHVDRILRDGVIKSHEREIYYKRIHDLFSYLELLYKKKIIFCQHPRADYPLSENFEKIKKNFKVAKYETDKYISQSYLSIFLSSMSIGYAISLKKKIILIKSKLLGNFYSLRSDILRKTIELFEIDIDSQEYKKIDEKKLNSELIHKISNYDKFIQDNLIKDDSDNYSNQIKKIVFKEFF